MNTATHSTRSRSRTRPPRTADGLLLALGSALIYVSLGALLFREITASDSLVNLGPYNVTTAEPILVLLGLGLGFALIANRFRINAIVVAGVLLLAATVIAIVRGMLVDPLPALFTARQLVSIPLFLLFGAVVAPIDELHRRIAHAVKICGTVLAIMTVSRLTTGFPYGGALEFDGRALLNYGALMISFAAMLMISDRIRGIGARAQLPLAAFLLVACVLTGQGTVILATMAGLPIIVLAERGRLRAARWLAAFPLIIVLVGLLIVQPILSQMIADDQLLSSYFEDRASTNATRQAVWDAFLTQYSSRDSLDQAFGLPMGKTETLVLNLWHGTYWNRTLHSMYFETLSNFGYIGLTLYIIGLVLILTFLLLNFRAATRRAEPQKISVVSALALTVMLVIFGYSYDLRGESSLLLMIVAAVAVNSSIRRPLGTAAASRSAIGKRQTITSGPAATH